MCLIFYFLCFQSLAQCLVHSQAQCALIEETNNNNDNKLTGAGEEEGHLRQKTKPHN